MRPAADRPSRAAHLAALAAVCLAAAAPAAAAPVRVVRLTPAAQTTTPEALVPIPFAARVELVDGTVVPGAQVAFEVDVCVSLPVPGAECPTAAEYGGFEAGGPGRPLTVIAITDSNGVATAPPYRAGTPATTGGGDFTFAVFPYVPAQTTLGGLVITLFDATHPLTPIGAEETTITVLAQHAVEVPALSTSAALALTLLLAAAALARLR